jgi:hypothetical protein
MVSLPRTRLEVFALMLGCVTALGAERALAHDPPEGLSLVFADESPGSLPLIVTNRGLVFADAIPIDGGTRYMLRCNESYEAASTDRPSVFYGEAGGLIIGVPYHVQLSSDRACGVSKGTGHGEDPTTPLVRHPSAPQRLFLATRTYETPSVLYVSEDYGRTFNKRYETSVGTFFDGLLVAPSRAERMIAPAVSFDKVNVVVNTFCARSDDSGASWTFQPLGSRKIVPFAVHPRLPDVVFAHEPLDRLETTYRVLRSTDGGAHFESVLENVIKPTTLAATEHYTFLGIGGNGGLYRSSDDGAHFERVQRDTVQSVTCAHTRAGRLWLCLNMAPNENGIWYSDDEAATLTKLMSFEQVTQPLVCEQNQAVCAGPWYDFDRELRPPLEDAGAAGLDAGSDTEAGTDPDAGAETEAGALDAGQDEPEEAGHAEEAGTGSEPSTRRRSGGCQLGSHAVHGEALGLLVLGLSLVRRRRGRAL